MRHAVVNPSLFPQTWMSAPTGAPRTRSAPTLLAATSVLATLASPPATDSRGSSMEKRTVTVSGGGGHGMSSWVSAGETPPPSPSAFLHAPPSPFSDSLQTQMNASWIQTPVAPTPSAPTHWAPTAAPVPWASGRKAPRDTATSGVKVTMAPGWVSAKAPAGPALGAKCLIQLESPSLSSSTRSSFLKIFLLFFSFVVSFLLSVTFAHLVGKTIGLLRSQDLAILLANMFYTQQV